MTVYVVEKGSNSGCHIEAIFSNKKAAEEYRLWRYDEPDFHIEEYDVNSELFENIFLTAIIQKKLKEEQNKED